MTGGGILQEDNFHSLGNGPDKHCRNSLQIDMTVSFSGKTFFYDMGCWNQFDMTVKICAKIFFTVMEMVLISIVGTPNKVG